MSELFGTDGVRGVANEMLTPQLATDLGRAIAALSPPGSRPKIVVGRDTRRSGQMLEAALSAGVMAAGGDVVVGGVLPTPAVAMLVPHLRADAGVVISASHNPYTDNGIKFFASDGYKLTDEAQSRIQALVGDPPPGVTGAAIGNARRAFRAQQTYVSGTLRALEGRHLEGLKVVLDCGNGAAYRTSPAAFRQAGAELVTMNCSPDGTNINRSCGSTNVEAVADRVVDTGSDLGLAHDGDADRVIAVDETGAEVDGDAMIALLALELKEAGELQGGLVVSTVMANLGLRKALAASDIELVETPVGDRFVLQAMRQRGASIGGEQSGHLILSRFGTTGDGLVTGLRLAGRMVSTGRKLSDLASVVRRFPQVLVNVKVPSPQRVESSSTIQKQIERTERELHGSGRILVRASGTEPLVRVMVEAADQPTAQAVADEVAQLIGRELG
ncbi:MAG: phosphoglucosamine mutase [Actinomycetota bacterium]